MNTYHFPILKTFTNYLFVCCLSSFFYLIRSQDTSPNSFDLPVELSTFFSTSNTSTQSFVIQFPENWYTLHSQLISSSPDRSISTTNDTQAPNAALPLNFKDLGAHLPWNNNMALSRENYEKYLTLWNKKILQKTGDYQVIIEPTDTSQSSLSSTNSWLLRLIGEGSYSGLTWIYHLDSQSWQSPNMQLNYLGEIQMHEQSILGAWSGKVWQNSRQNSQGLWIETLAIGKDSDHHTILIYRTQAIDPKNKLWIDESLILRHTT